MRTALIKLFAGVANSTRLIGSENPVSINTVVAVRLSVAWKDLAARVVSVTGRGRSVPQAWMPFRANGGAHSPWDLWVHRAVALGSGL